MVSACSCMSLSQVHNLLPRMYLSGRGAGTGTTAESAKNESVCLVANHGFSRSALNGIRAALGMVTTTVAVTTIAAKVDSRRNGQVEFVLVATSIAATTPTLAVSV